MQILQKCEKFNFEKSLYSFRDNECFTENTNHSVHCDRLIGGCPDYSAYDFTPCDYYIFLNCIPSTEGPYYNGQFAQLYIRFLKSSDGERSRPSTRSNHTLQYVDDNGYYEYDIILYDDAVYGI